MLIDVSEIPISQVKWRGAVRIMRSVYPPIDLFEDIADPADWPLLISAEQKTNPPDGDDWKYRLSAASTPGRRARGELSNGAFHSREYRPPEPLQPGTIRRPLCRTALLKTAHHHARFMAKTNEPAGWTSQFREILPQTAGSHPVTVLLATPGTSLRAALYRESGLVQ